MKRSYVEPAMVREEFAANEYVAACGDSGVVYNFVCDAGYIISQEEHSWGRCGCGTSHYGAVPSGTYEYKTKGSWYVTSGPNRTGNSLMNGYSSYSPCGATHEAESDGSFVKGYMDNLSTKAIESVEVMTWAGPRNNNIHCTTALDMDSWETAKS